MSFPDIEEPTGLMLYDILREHWCYEFPYGESCKHCSLELTVCDPIDKILQSLSEKAKTEG